MDIAEVDRSDSGLWHLSVFPGHADELLAALDPDLPFVLIETWDGVSGWHEVEVGIGTEMPRRRLVRRHTFDLLVTPAEAVEVGRHLRAQGLARGGLGCFQFTEMPSASFSLPSDGAALAAAMRGQGVELAIDVPHDAEVAVVTSPHRERLESYRIGLS